MTSHNEDPTEEKAIQQEIRTKLRESFLRAVSELNGQECSILTYEKSLLPATFAGWNVEGNEVLVKNLKTPARHNMASALLRTSDLLAIHFDKPIQLSK